MRLNWPTRTPGNPDVWYTLADEVAEPWKLCEICREQLPDAANIDARQTRHASCTRLEIQK